MSEISKTRPFLWVVLAFAFAGLIWGIAIFMPVGIDWHTIFRPTVWRFIRGEELYGVPLEGNYFLNPPWTLLPLLPLAFLPEAIGRSILMVISIASFMFVAHRLGGNLPATILLLLSPPVIQGLLNANIDWLAALGFILPPQIGLFFISIKPQMGLAVGLYWLYDIWRHKGFQKVVQVFSPFLVVLLLSFAIWGFWPLNFNSLLGVWWNASFWPYSIPFGIILLSVAIIRRKINYAMAASPCFSPYIVYHSLVGAVLAVIHSFPTMVFVFLGLWILEFVL